MNEKKLKKFEVMCEIGSVGAMTIYIRASSKKVVTLQFIRIIYKGVTSISSVKEVKSGIVESAYVVE